jgi:hypothetical protein
LLLAAIAFRRRRPRSHVDDIRTRPG